MKQLIFIISVLVAGCCSSKSNTNVATDNIVTTDSSFKPAVPECINKLIAQFKAEEKQNPPRKIYSYRYKGNTVYYVPAICCDFFSDLYNSKCELIGHPDGGFTGRGDGKTTDFDSTKTNERLVWADERGK